MTSRAGALVCAVVAIGLVVAQIVKPGLALFHTWQYAFGLVLLAWPLLANMRGRFALALAGALIVDVAGLVSGLLGADTERVVRAPGTVGPVPDLGGAAFFSPADAAAIARGDATVIFRRTRHLDVIVTPTSRKFLGTTVLALEPRPAAYLDATDARGAHLTITQPSGPSFLSPILLFREQQTIAGAVHPVDAFSLPGVHRGVKAVYFSGPQTQTLRLEPDAVGKLAVLYAVENEGGKQRGIAMAPSGRWARVEGLRLRAVLGTYPQLVIASAPHPYALVAGLALFFWGLLAALFARRPPEPTGSASLVDGSTPRGSPPA